MYYDIENYASELWVTTKQFEEDLKKNHNRYEKRISDLKKEYDRKSAKIKEVCAFYIQA